MLIVLLSFFISSAHAQIKELSELDVRTPIFVEEKKELRKYRIHKNKFEPTHPSVGLEEILSSPEELGVVKAGTYIYHLDNSKKLLLDKDIYIRFHRQPDEQGFKYLVSKNGDIKYKVETLYIFSIAQETVMYEPPHSYTPAPERKRVFWDEKLSTKFELGVAASVVRANFLKDLLNLDNTPEGRMNHFGLNYLADWDWPVKIGLGVYYQKASFDTDGETTNFSSVSFGPIFKSKNFYPGNIPLRLQAQIRYSPFAKMDVSTSNGSTGFDFNTTDLLAGVEFPFQNNWGEFVVSLFTHYQWLNLKNQDEIVNIESSSKPNQAIGLGISQVF